MAKYSLLLAVFCLQLFGTESVPQCDHTLIANCAAMLPTSFPSSDADYYSYCGLRMNFTTCVNGLTCAMDDVAYLGIMGQVDSIGYVCSTVNPEIQKVYLRNAGCIAGVVPDINAQCNTSIPPAEVPLDQTCAYFNTRAACILNYTTTTCNAESGRFVATVFAKMERRIQQNAYNCSITALPCSAAEFVGCGALAPRLNANPPTNPWTRTNFDGFCSGATAFNTCISAVSCVASDELYTNMTVAIGMVDAFKYMCMDNVTNVFIQNQQCAVPLMSTIAASCQGTMYPANASNADICT